jgi:hypothetical protein
VALYNVGDYCTLSRFSDGSGAAIPVNVSETFYIYQNNINDSGFMFNKSSFESSGNWYTLPAKADGKDVYCTQKFSESAQPTGIINIDVGRQITSGDFNQDEYGEGIFGETELFNIQPFKIHYNNIKSGAYRDISNLYGYSVVLQLNGNILIKASNFGDTPSFWLNLWDQNGVKYYSNGVGLYFENQYIPYYDPRELEITLFNPVFKVSFNYNNNRTFIETGYINRMSFEISHGANNYFMKNVNFYPLFDCFFIEEYNV